VVLCKDSKASADAKILEDIPVKKGWLGKLLNVRTIEPSKESHAKSLSDKDNLYEVMCMYCIHS
jgi:hypothetical protein